MEELSKSYLMNCFKDFAFIEKPRSSNEASFPIFNWQVVNKQVKPVATSHFFSRPIATVASLTTGLSLDFFYRQSFYHNSNPTLHLCAFSVLTGFVATRG